MHTRAVVALVALLLASAHAGFTCLCAPDNGCVVVTCASLPSALAVSSMTSLVGSLVVGNESTSFALPNLVTISDSLTFDAPSLLAVSFPVLEQVDKVEMTNVSSLRNVSMPALVTCSNFVIDAPALTTLHLPSVVAYISFSLKGAALGSFAVETSVAGGAYSFESMGALTNLTVRGYLDSVVLKALPALVSFEVLGADTFKVSQTGLIKFDAGNSSSIIDFSVVDNAALEEIAATNVDLLAGQTEINDNPSLTTLTFPFLTEYATPAMPSIRMERNALLCNFCPLCPMAINEPDLTTSEATPIFPWNGTNGFAAKCAGPKNNDCNLCGSITTTTAITTTTTTAAAAATTTSETTTTASATTTTTDVSTTTDGTATTTTSDNSTSTSGTSTTSAATTAAATTSAVTTATTATTSTRSTTATTTTTAAASTTSSASGGAGEAFVTITLTTKSGGEISTEQLLQKISAALTAAGVSTQDTTLVSTEQNGNQYVFVLKLTGATDDAALASAKDVASNLNEADLGSVCTPDDCKTSAKASKSGATALGIAVVLALVAVVMAL